MAIQKWNHNISIYPENINTVHIHFLFNYHDAYECSFT